MKIGRAMRELLLRRMKPGKVHLLMGARRTGKTLFLKDMVSDLPSPVLRLEGEDLDTQALFRNRTLENYRRLVGDHKTLVLDEAQKIPGIGEALKFMIDQIPELYIIATGSSTFDLGKMAGEPLTGRSLTFRMFPLALMEYVKHETAVQTRSRLEERLIYGCYPELISLSGAEQKEEYLRELMHSWLLKDILEVDGVRNSSKMYDLLRLVAFQSGNEVSLDELARNLQMSKNTVERYLDLLSKVFVIFRIGGFSRNLRKEVTKSAKWYFTDNGIRNALISDFRPLANRDDTGRLWENFLVSERIKRQHYTQYFPNNYFWRTYDRQEIDWVEEKDGKLSAYEFKWNPDERVKIPAAWKDAYPDSSFSVIHPDNYLDWLL